MLSVFPALLTFGIFAPLILRLALGAFFLLTSVHRFSERPKQQRELVWAIAALEFVAGVLLVLGFLTQIAALFGAVYAVALLVLREQHNKKLDMLVTAELFVYIFIFAAAVALILAGPGALAIDLPL